MVRTYALAALARRTATGPARAAATTTTTTTTCRQVRTGVAD